jgi:O-antigen ligase
MRYSESAQRLITCLVVALAPLPLGSVGLFWILLWLGLLSVALLCASWTGITTAQRFALAALLLICALYLIDAMLQLVPNPMLLPGNPIWARARILLDLPLSERVSIRAELPSLGLSHLLLFFAASANGLFLGIRGDSDSFFWRVLAFVGLAYAAFGLVMNIVDPGEILFVEKTAYVGAVTASFVNRNTAATYFGTTTIIWFVLCWRAWLQRRPYSMRVLFGSSQNSGANNGLVRRIVAFLICVAALVGTGSRGGILSTAFGLCAVIFCLVEANLKKYRLYLLASAVPILLLAGYVVSEAMSARLSSVGLFDQQRWSTYGSALEIIHDFPWMGTGLGTFADIFPQYRSPDAALWGVWDFAHNTILEIAVEMGFPMAMFIAVAYLAALRFFLVEASRATSQRRLSLITVAGTTALGLAHSLIDFSLQIPGMMIPFAVLLGFGLARCFAGQEPEIPFGEMQEGR